MDKPAGLQNYTYLKKLPNKNEGAIGPGCERIRAREVLLLLLIIYTIALTYVLSILYTDGTDIPLAMIFAIRF